MNKTNRSILNLITSVVLMILNGVFNIVVIRKIIEVYGSDFNGLNSTATQFINILLIVEGGFTLAANVSLFEPLAVNDANRINSIIAAVNIRFKKIGFVFFILGVFSAIGFSFFVKTELPFYVPLFTFLMLVLSTTFNLVYSIKYKILFQSNQCEYLLNIISIITTILSNGFVLIAISFYVQNLVIRVIIMCCAILQGCIVAFTCKKSYKYININTEPAFEQIHGTKDVFVQQVTGLIYSSIPILFISSFVGTKYASIYAVYNTVFVLIKGLNSSFINAPRMGLGRLIKENKYEHSYILSVFNQYEFISILFITCMLSVTAALLMPFITIYTEGITDIDYTNWFIAITLIGTTFFELLHIPSGNIINMSGNFKMGRNIQFVAGAVLIVAVIIGGILFSMYGIIFAVLLTAIFLAILEIYYVHQKYFNGAWKQFFKNLILNTTIAIILVIIEININMNLFDFFHFFLYALILSIINSLIIFFVNMVFNKDITVLLFKRVKSTLFSLKSYMQA